MAPVDLRLYQEGKRPACPWGVKKKTHRKQKNLKGANRNLCGCCSRMKSAPESKTGSAKLNEPEKRRGKSADERG